MPCDTLKDSISQKSINTLQAIKLTGTTFSSVLILNKVFEQAIPLH